MGTKLWIIGFLLSVTKFAVIRAIGGQVSADCENYQFFGNCQKEELCLCFQSQWHRATFADIGHLSVYQGFSDICGNCSNLQPRKCIDSTAHLQVISELTTNNLIQQSTETECQQILKVDQASTTATTGGQDVTSTSHMTTSTESSTSMVDQTTATTGGQDVTSTSHMTTSTESSTSMVDQTTATTGGQDVTSTSHMTTSTESSTSMVDQTLTTATTGGQDVTSTSHMTTSTESSMSTAMCPCQCDYYDKIEYWAQDTNQRKQYEELSQKLAEIKSLLKVETKNLSSFVNTKISAADDRPSVAVTGFLGASIMAIVLVGIVLLDLPVIIRQAGLLFRDLKRICVREL